MKNIKHFITEQLLLEGSWSFNRSERDAFVCAVGYLTGSLGDADEIADYAPFKDTLTPDELKQFDEIFDILDDDYTYNKVGSKYFKQNKELLKRFAEWIDDNNLTQPNGRWNWDLVDACDKITSW